MSRKGQRNGYSSYRCLTGLPFCFEKVEKQQTKTQKCGSNRKCHSEITVTTGCGEQQVVIMLILGSFEYLLGATTLGSEDKKSHSLPKRGSHNLRKEKEK